MILIQFGGAALEPQINEHWHKRPTEVKTVPRIGEEVRLDGWCFEVTNVVHSFEGTIGKYPPLVVLKAI